jgi:predicted SnoaL-like aldol condensation-catalyzing enzyme
MDPKETVLAFYTEAFLDGRPEEAAARYVGDRYIQHNPQAGDGVEPFVQFVKAYRDQFPEQTIDFKRVLAEGDLVVTHSHFKTNASDRGTAVMDIFRLDNGKIVEHWDVLQPVPETAANNNTMF